MFDGISFRKKYLDSFIVNCCFFVLFFLKQGLLDKGGNEGLALSG